MGLYLLMKIQIFTYFLCEILNVNNIVNILTTVKKLPNKMLKMSFVIKPRTIQITEKINAKMLIDKTNLFTIIVFF